MASLTRYLKEKDHIEALKYFEVLDRLNTPLPDSITYFWGESLLSRRESKAALEKLYAYVQKAGKQGKYYTKALQLITEAEAQLDRDL